MGNLARYALSIGAAVALLAGCSGSQPTIGVPGAMPQSRAIATHPGHGGSWMVPEASTDDLIYATGGCGGTCVLSLPGGKLVGELNTSGDAICSDEQGNVFIVIGDAIDEYAHGGTTPIAILKLPGYISGGCSVDPTTNNLAVISDDSSTKTDVAIFTDESGTPTFYTSHIDSYSGGYDDAGNLFVDGYNGQQPGFAELPQGGAGFMKLSIPYTVGQPGTVQWDGKYITYEGRAPLRVSRLVITGSTATVVSTTLLNVSIHYALFSWIFRSKVLIPYNTHGVYANIIGIWKYPRGGDAIRTIRRFGDYGRRQMDFQGLAVSVPGPRQAGLNR